MKKYIFINLFLGIAVLGIFLRFYKLGSIPNSLNWDEVSWGYNAYSILKTGKDEYGVSYPMTFKAFGDYKQPVYVYLTTISVALFDLNSFAVRFPSAFFGSISIIVFYLMLYELFASLSFRKSLALIGMFFYAVSPWSIQFSRVAFEAQVGLVFVLIGSWMFLAGLNRKNNICIILSCIPLALSAYTYHSEKLFTPLVFLGLFLIGFTFFKERKIVAILLFLFFILLNSLWFLDARTTVRGRSVTFTSQQTVILSRSTKKIDYYKERGDIIGQVINNRRIIYFQKYVENYLRHFDPNYLFVTGDNPRHHAPGMGILYITNLPFIIVGAILSVRKRIKQIWFVYFWLFLGPVASALAIDSPNASRSLIVLPAWIIFEAFGWWYVFLFISQKLSYSKASVLKFTLIMLLLFNFIFWFYQYFTLTNSENSQYWQYGYRQAVKATGARPTFYGKDLEQPYIFYLFYNKVDPSWYIKNGGSDIRKKPCFQIKNAYFGDCEVNIAPGNFLVTNISDAVPNGFELFKTIWYPNGKESLVIYQKKK